MEKFKPPEDLPSKISSNSVEINLKFSTKSQLYFLLAERWVCALFHLNWLVAHQEVTLEKVKKIKMIQATMNSTK